MRVFMKKCGFSFLISIMFLLFAGRYVHVNDLYDKLDIHSGLVAGCLMLFYWQLCVSFIGLVSFIRDRRAAKLAAALTDPEA